MTAVDRAMRDLQVGALATAVLAVVEQTADQREVACGGCGGPTPGNCRRCCSSQAGRTGC